jgi:xylose isomerase
MRTYLILKEKARQFNEDAEIQALVAEIHADDGAMADLQGGYTSARAAALKAAPFDRHALAVRAMPYERLDQLTIELLLGVHS